jgi:hypothetical protein
MFYYTSGGTQVLAIKQLAEIGYSRWGGQDVTRWSLKKNLKKDGGRNYATSSGVLRPVNRSVRDLTGSSQRSRILKLSSCVYVQ